MVAGGSGKISKTLHLLVSTFDLRWDLLDDSGKYFFHMKASSGRNQDRLFWIKLKGIPDLFQGSLRLRRLEVDLVDDRHQLQAL